MSMHLDKNINWPYIHIRTYVILNWCFKWLTFKCRKLSTVKPVVVLSNYAHEICTTDWKSIISNNYGW